MKWIIGLGFVLIVGSLISAGVFMVRDRSRTGNMARALTWRIGLSIAVFLLILIGYLLGWIQPTGLPGAR
ncbi:MAG TPA: twin transmembrane helix small protein [Burkholderiaceae bacterium]|nr:twin transmembrane helix small protein [Burkholderiaceae bacterium]